MLPFLALALLQQPGRITKDTTYDGLLGKDSLLIQTPVERMATPKISPKNAWEFDWNVAGFAGSTNSHALRFELFSQESTQGSARPESVMRTLLRLFSFNVAKMRLEHAPDFGNVVQVYLCYGGQPGGEQLYDVDKSLGSKVDTVYFYDLRSFTDPVETTREVAHEYGHAVLPPIGGDYTAPEAWANGYLGEKLYLSYLADARSKGELGPEDTFGATPESLRAWVRANVDPLVERALTRGPEAQALAGKDKAAMDSFFGLALATAKLCGPQTMLRALFVNGTAAKDFPASAGTAAEEPEFTTLNVPDDLRAKPIWVPLGEGKQPQLSARVSGADVIDVRDGWARLRPRSATVKIVVRGIKR